MLNLAAWCRWMRPCWRRAVVTTLPHSGSQQPVGHFPGDLVGLQLGEFLVKGQWQLWRCLPPPGSLWAWQKGSATLTARSRARSAPTQAAPFPSSGLDGQTRRSGWPGLPCRPQLRSASRHQAVAPPEASRTWTLSCSTETGQQPGRPGNAAAGVVGRPYPEGVPLPGVAWAAHSRKDGSRAGAFRGAVLPLALTGAAGVASRMAWPVFHGEVGQGLSSASIAARARPGPALGRAGGWPGSPGPPSVPRTGSGTAGCSRFRAAEDGLPWPRKRASPAASSSWPMPAASLGRGQPRRQQGPQAEIRVPPLPLPLGGGRG